MRGQLPDIFPSSGACRATFPPRGKAFSAGWGHPALRGNKNHCAVGAGHAPPATLCYNEYYGYSVGAAYMPPVQPTRQINLTGKPHGTHICVPYKPAEGRNVPVQFVDSLLFYPCRYFFGKNRVCLLQFAPSVYYNHCIQQKMCCDRAIYEGRWCLNCVPETEDPDCR